MKDEVVDAELVSAPLAKKDSGGITLVVGSPMDESGFSQLESHLLSRSPGRFIVISAPGNVMGNQPYRISSDVFNIGFNDYEINLVIPRKDLLNALRPTLGEKEFAAIKNYYESLKNLSETTGQGEIIFRTYGNLTFQKKEELTRVSHTFPSNFPQVYVNGAALQRRSPSPSLGNVAALRIGDEIKMVYADNTPRER